MGRAYALDVGVCVIGAGPAGSTFATKLALMGHSVCLVDRAAFPRPRLGESLTPGVLPLLQTIGASELARATGIPTTTISMRWGNGEQERSSGPRGLLVDRARFDAALLEHAAANGVTTYAPATVGARELVRDDKSGERSWHLIVRTPRGLQRIRARLLADASGRNRALKGKRLVTGRRSTALYAYHRAPGVGRPARIEAGDSAWFWRVPLPDGRENHLAFVDSERLRQLLSNDSLEGVYDALHAASDLRAHGRGTHRQGPVRATDATPYLDADCVGESTIKVGDAALAIDPISSSGVQKALQSALAAAIVVNTWLRKPALSRAASQFYRDSLRSSSDAHRTWAAEHYALVAARHEDRFFLDRAHQPLGSNSPGTDVAAPVRPETIASARVMLSPSLRLEQTPCLGESFVSVQLAISHPNLERPCAFIDGVAIAPLLNAIEPGMTPIAIARRWSSEVSLRTGLKIATWLLRSGILVEKGEKAGPSE